MPNVLIRDLSDKVHAGLQHRAEAAGQSLQQYLASELARLVSNPSMEEVLDRIGRHRNGRVGLSTAVSDLHELRGER